VHAGLQVSLTWPAELKNTKSTQISFQQQQSRKCFVREAVPLRSVDT